MKIQALLASLFLGLVACGGTELDLAGVDSVDSALVTLAPPSFAGGVTDRRSIRETAVTLPAAGGSYVDPDFKTKIIRVTDAKAFGATGCYHSYSSVPATNVDTTRILVACGNAARLYKFDKATDRPTHDNTLTAGQAYSINWESAIWSGQNPNILYVLGAPSGQRITRLYQVDVTRTDAGRFTLVKDFAGVWGGTWTIWQLSRSEDDNVFSFHLRDSSGNYYRSGAFIRSQAKAVMFPDTAFLVDETYVEKGGRYITINGKGANAYTIKIWNPWTNAVTTTLTNTATNKVGGHYDEGSTFYVNGDRFATGLLVRGWGALAAPKNVFQYQRADGTLNWNIADHVSMRNANEAFAVLSTYGYMDPAWPAFQHEIVLVKTDGTGFSRVAHTRSAGKASSYWSEPRASVDRDGRYVVFTSDHNTYQNDVWMVKLPL